MMAVFFAMLLLVLVVVLALRGHRQDLPSPWAIMRCPECGLRIRTLADDRPWCKHGHQPRPMIRDDADGI